MAYPHVSFVKSNGVAGTVIVDDPQLNAALVSAVSGTAFTRLKAAIEAKTSSIGHVFETLDKWCRRSHDSAAWFVDERFGYRFFLVRMTETWEGDQIKMPFWITLERGGGLVSIVEWGTFVVSKASV